MTTQLSQSQPRSVTGWPVRRTPLWLFGVLAALLAGAVLVGLAHRPTNSERATDLRSVITTLNTGIESCAGGLRDSLTAMRAIGSGTSHDRATALSIARGGAANCSPANNQQLADLTQYQVPESLAGFKLAGTVDDLVTWAFPWAQRAQEDIAGVLAARTPAARSQASAKLQSDLRTLDGYKSAIDNALTRVARSLGSAERPPVLPR